MLADFVLDGCGERRNFLSAHTGPSTSCRNYAMILDMFKCFAFKYVNWLHERLMATIVNGAEF